MHRAAVAFLDSDGNLLILLPAPAWAQPQLPLAPVLLLQRLWLFLSWHLRNRIICIAIIQTACSAEYKGDLVGVFPPAFQSKSWAKGECTVPAHSCLLPRPTGSEGWCEMTLRQLSKPCRCLWSRGCSAWCGQHSVLLRRPLGSLPLQSIWGDSGNVHESTFPCPCNPPQRVSVPHSCVSLILHFQPGTQEFQLFCWGFHLPAKLFACRAGAKSAFGSFPWADLYRGSWVLQGHLAAFCGSFSPTHSGIHWFPCCDPWGSAVLMKRNVAIRTACSTSFTIQNSSSPIWYLMCWTISSFHTLFL